MTTAERKERNQRSTALTCGLIAEVAMGGTLVVWSGSAAPLGREALGRVGSVVAVVAAMVLLALGLLAIMLRLGRGVLRVAVVAVAVAVGGLGVVAISALVQDPGIGILLALGFVMTVPVILEITRASAKARKTA